jgi:hypothetical protein
MFNLDAGPKIMVRWNSSNQTFWTATFKDLLPSINMGFDTYTWEQVTDSSGFFIPRKEIPAGHRFASPCYRQLHCLLNTYDFIKGVTTEADFVCFAASDIKG